MSNNGPTFTKATYDSKRPRPTVPDPDRVKATIEVAALDAAKSRSAHQDVNRAGGLGPWALEQLRKPQT
jgi:hypothetical protein